MTARLASASPVLAKRPINVSLGPSVTGACTSTQMGDVVDVFRTQVVPAVREQLLGGRDARHGDALDGADDA